MKIIEQMTTTEIEAELNAMLSSEKPSVNRLSGLITSLAEKSGIKPELLDFEYYSESRKAEMHRKKVECAKNQDFETGAVYLRHEKNCDQYIELRKEENITESCFRIDGEFLFFFSIGSSENEALIKSEYKRLMKIYPISYVDPE